MTEEKTNKEESQIKTAAEKQTERKQPQIISLSAADMQGFLAEERKNREARCLQRIMTVLQEENCRADAKVTIFGTNFASEIVVSAYAEVPVAQSPQEQKGAVN